RKALPDLVQRFEATMSAVAGANLRKMFGYPAAFAANGHMFTGLHEDRWVIRLPDDARAELAGAGGVPFEPMPGRPMREYLVLPAAVLDDAAMLQTWLDRSLIYTEGLPTKAKKR
ncbi:MAG TPA: TfoX/Sxy family protein, partial [Candidatus Dormibacteraeota bacterium]|nr:TfoX/Sxy family protein [Candidatus Dormibacteraeota bacterium]